MSRKKQVIKKIDLEKEIGHYFDTHQKKIPEGLDKESFVDYASLSLKTRYNSRKTFNEDIGDFTESLAHPEKVELKRAKRAAVNKNDFRAEVGDLRQLNNARVMPANLIEVDIPIDAADIPASEFELSEASIVGYYKINSKNTTMILAKVTGQAFNIKTETYESEQSIWCYLDGAKYGIY